MNCINCNKSLTNRQKKYCSNQCQMDYQHNKYIARWLDGQESGYIKDNNFSISNHIRRFLLKEYNNSCEKCGFDKLHPTYNTPILQINHIDGNAKNCIPSNLELLCPNCHVMTDNYGSRNKNSCRIR